LTTMAQAIISTNEKRLDRGREFQDVYFCHGRMTIVTLTRLNCRHCKSTKCKCRRILRPALSSLMEFACIAILAALPCSQGFVQGCIDRSGSYQT
jgi:hypothetical protein